MDQVIWKLWYLILCVIEISLYRKLGYLNYTIPAQSTPSLLFTASILFYIAHFKNKKYHRCLSYMTHDDLLFQLKEFKMLMQSNINNFKQSIIPE